ncbi:MAG: hypothetical protein ACOYNY_36095 [Caldilineaceae bacterium]
MSKLVGIGVALIIIFGCASLAAFSQWNNCITQEFGSRSLGTECMDTLSLVSFASAGATLGMLILGIGIVRSFLKRKPIEVNQGPTYVEHIGRDKISTGNISGSTGVAIGKHNQLHINSLPIEFTQRFNILNQIIKTAPIETRQEASSIAEALNLEIVKGHEANDEQIARLIEELVQLVPATVGAVIMIFSVPIIKNSVGPVTTYVLSKFESKLRLT